MGISGTSWAAHRTGTRMASAISSPAPQHLLDFEGDFVWVKMTASSGASAMPRRVHGTRIDFRRRAVLTDSDGAVFEVGILDVSSAGFRLQTSAPLRVGEKITLNVDRSPSVAGEIRWILGNEAGGIFIDAAPSAL